MIDTQKLLGELIALPSVNNALLPPNHPRAGEGRVAEFLASIATKAGLEVNFQKVFPGRANMIARLVPAGKVKRRIMLAPHMDTVDIANEGQLKPVKRNGRIYGRG